MMKAPNAHAGRAQAIQVPRGTTGKLNDPGDALILELRREILERLARASEGTVVHLAFDQVTLSASCHAAVLAPAIERIVRGELKGRHLLGVDPSGRNTWDADAGLAKESKTRGVKLVCAWRGFQEKPELVGAVDEQVNSTYLFVVRQGETTARDLAEQAGLSIQAASNRFAKASQLGVIVQSGRRPVAGGGIEHLYQAIR
jgi:hypothetical protein